MKRVDDPLVQCSRAASSGLLLPSVFARKASRPFRLWMTGSLAVVMAAMILLR